MPLFTAGRSAPAPSPPLDGGKPYSFASAFSHFVSLKRDTIELGFFAQQVAIGPSGNLAVLGRDLVQRRSPDGDVLVTAVVEGYWGLDMEIDAACDVYVSGSDQTGAFLVKLD